MKCPYNDKIDACIYLEQMTEDNKVYECPTCPHYKPRRYLKSANDYYNDPERESFAFLAISVCIGVLSAMIIFYLGLKLTYLIIGWLF